MLNSQGWGFFLLFGAFFGAGGLWGELRSVPQGVIEGDFVEVVKLTLTRLRGNRMPERPAASISALQLVGQDFIFRYEQCFNRPAHLLGFTAGLVFHEELRQPDGEGDKVEGKQRTVQEFQLGPEYIAGEIFQDERTFTIPDDAIPTFVNIPEKSVKHSGKWSVRVRMDLAEVPTLTNEYEFPVGSEGPKRCPRPVVYEKSWFGGNWRFG